MQREKEFNHELANATYQEPLQVDNSMIMMSELASEDIYGVGRYPKEASNSLLLLDQAKSAGKELVLSLVAITTSKKISPVKTLHDLVTY